MTQSQAAPKRRLKVPGFFLFFVGSIIPATAVGLLLGAGPVAVIGGLVALFTLIALMGGSLRSDLRLAQLIAPLVFIGAVVPRLLSEVSPWGAIAIVVGIVFIAALAPLRASRFSSAGLGLGFATLFAYSFAPPGGGPTSAPQLMLAVAIGILVAVGMRVLYGFRDPSGPTRGRAAALLDGEQDAAGGAVEAWLADDRPTWIGVVIAESLRFGSLMRAAERDPQVSEAEIAALRARAHDLAAGVNGKEVPAVAPAAEAETGGAAPELPSAPTTLAASARLDAVEGALTTRDASPAPMSEHASRPLNQVISRPGRFARSVQLRHAIRTALGVLLFLIVGLFIPDDDPIFVTAMLTTYGILQTSWRASLSKSWERIAGVIGGGLLAVVLLFVLPQPVLMVAAAIALVVGIWFITSRPALGYTLMVVVSVGFGSARFEPGLLLIEYVILMVAAVAIGLLVGFAVVPTTRRGPMAERMRTARTATIAVLDGLAVEASPSTIDTTIERRRELSDSLRPLVPDREKLTPEQAKAVGELRTELRDLAALAAICAGEGPEGRAAISQARAILAGDAGSVAPGESDAPASVLTAMQWLAGDVVARIQAYPSS